MIISSPAAHNLGIKIIVDFPANDTNQQDAGEYGSLYNNGTFMAACNNDPNDYFHHNPGIGNFEDRYQLQYYTLEDLSDLNQENSTIDGYLKQSLQTFQQNGTDAFRMDAVKHTTWGWEYSEANSIYNNAPSFVFGEWYETTSDSLFADSVKYANKSGMALYDYPLGLALRDVLGNAMELAHRPFPLPNRVFRNKGGLSFEDVSAKAGASFQATAPHRGAAFGDLNNDGKIDVVVTVLNGPPEIWMNRSGAHVAGKQNHWIILKLIGVKSNRDGLGTKIKITTSLGTQFNQATTAVSYNSSSDKRVHFGLGSANVVDAMELTWPSGIKQVLKNVKADQIVTVTESASQ